MTRPAFQDYQFALTAHLRDPKQVERPQGTSKRRVAVYTELIFNNVNGFLEGVFPVLRRILKKKRWKRQVRGFLRDHRSHSPLFREIPLAFVDYLSTLDADGNGLPPFALELAHYEWLELKLDIDPRAVRWPRQRRISVELPMALNPVLELVAYRFPVHEISPGFQPDLPSAEPNFLLVWRDRHQRVRFMQLNTASARLLHGLQQGESAAVVAGLLGGDTQVVQDELQQWLDADILLGVKRQKKAAAG